MKDYQIPSITIKVNSVSRKKTLKHKVECQGVIPGQKTNNKSEKYSQHISKTKS